MPLGVFLDEALGIARFVEARGKSVRKHGELVRRGLDLAGEPELAGPIAHDIRALVEEIHAAHSAYEASITKSRAPELLREGRACLADLRATAEWLATTSKKPDHREMLRNVREPHKFARAIDAVALALEDFARLVAELTGRGKPLDGATPDALARAYRLAAALRHHASRSSARAPAHDALQARNALIAKLMERVRRVRAAARYVWRNEPEVVRQVTSAYERAKKRKPRTMATAFPVAPQNAP